MRSGFVTCVELGRSCVETILDLGGQFEMLVTLDDGISVNKAGRVYLEEIARAHEIPLLKVRNINDPSAVEAIRSADLDWLFIIGWSQIAGPEILSSARRGVLGMHPTLLPAGRGRASIPWAILKGLGQTGVTMFQLDEGVDTGPVLAQRTVDIAPRETAATLYDKINQAHVQLMRAAWPLLHEGSPVLTPQDESSATEWPGRRPSDGEILPEIMTVDEVDRLVRAVTRPYPGAFVRNPDGTRTRVWQGTPAMNGQLDAAGKKVVIALADGAFLATEFQLEPSDDSTREWG